MSDVPVPSRRSCLTGAAALLALFHPRAEAMADDREFIAEATRQRDAAVAAGDQPYGAVLVRDGRIIGTGRSRVVSDGNSDAHAERVALWDAQRRLGREMLDGSLIYATSIPCALCQIALARAGVASMRVGPEGRDAGMPRGALR